MNITDLLSQTTEFLAEANILNVKDPHDGHSIQEFLKFYAKELNTAPAKKMFIKKMQKLLLNNPKFHFAVRELPQGAPDWAQQAMANRDLFYFAPNEELKNEMQHLVHYLSAVERDMEQTADNDKKVFATKEFNAFPKAESIELLVKKSNDYFARGTKEQKETEGMKEIYNIGNGFTWYKLEEPEAFKREGNVLQNCIGSFWTHSKCVRQGQSIVVLRSPKNVSVVAARIKNGDNELQEMKGKNNKPPIPNYMPPVASLINKFKLNLSYGALSDLRRAGYFYHEGKLLTKPQAMKEMVKHETIADLGNGLKITKASVDTESHQAIELFKEIYEDVLHSTGWRLSKLYDVYEIRNKEGIPLVVASVDEHAIRELKTYFDEKHRDKTILGENIEQDKQKEIISRLVSTLVDKGIISDISSDPLRHVFWQVGLTWDKENKVLRTRAPSDHHETDKSHHKWEVYTGSDLNTLISTLRTDNNFERRYLGSENKPKTAYVTVEHSPTGRDDNEHKTFLVAIVDDSDTGSFFTVHGHQIHKNHTGFKKEFSRGYFGDFNVEPIHKDKKTINSIVGLAKSKGFSIPLKVRLRLGIIGGKPDQYSLYQPEWEKITSGEIEGEKLDLSKMRDDDRLRALYSVITGDFKSKHTHFSDKFDYHGEVDSALGGILPFSDDNEEPEESHEDRSKRLAAAQKKLYGNIDAMYKVDVGFGVDDKHGVLLLVSNNKVQKIDKDTEHHRWQSWDDYENVTKQLNAFAKEHKLTFNPNAIKADRRERIEFRVGKDGYLTTVGAQKAKELSRKKKKEGTDELKFKDNWTLTRMDPEVQAKWMRHDLQDNVRGQGWLLKDNEGGNQAIFVILHNRPLRMFVRGTTTDEQQMPIEQRVDKKVFQYLKGAMKALGWKDPNTGSLKSQTQNPLHHDAWELLKYCKSVADRWDTMSLHDKRVAHRRLRNRHLGTLVKLGLVKRIAAEDWDKLPIKLTPHGRTILKKVEDGKIEKMTPIINFAKTVEPHSEFKKEGTKKKKASSATPIRTRQSSASGQSKAELALQKFRDHVEEHGSIPSRSQFIEYMQEEPFNMSKSGAQTYYYTTKKKYANLNESVVGSLARFLLVEPDMPLSSLSNII